MSTAAQTTGAVHESVSERSIVLWYVISIVTLGIATLVWYYTINNDAKKFAIRRGVPGAHGQSPGLSVVAVTLGAFLIVPPFVSVWKTWSRVREATGSQSMAAGMQFLFSFVPLVHLAYWGILQSHLNEAARESGA